MPRGDVDARVHLYTATILGRGRWLVLRSAAFNPGERHWYSFYRTLSGPQDQSRHERVMKNLHPLDTRALHPLAKRHAAWFTWPTGFWSKIFNKFLCKFQMNNNLAYRVSRYINNFGRTIFLELNRFLLKNLYTGCKRYRLPKKYGR